MSDNISPIFVKGIFQFSLKIDKEIWKIGAICSFRVCFAVFFTHNPLFSILHEKERNLSPFF